VKYKLKSKNEKQLKVNAMLKKLEKLEEVNNSLTRRINDLETYMFVENIDNSIVIETKKDNHKAVVELK